MGPKFCPQVPPPMTQEKKLTRLQNPRVKRLSFSQKMIISVFIPGVVPPPQDPQNLVGMVPMGPKFCPQACSMKREKKLTCL